MYQMIYHYKNAIAQHKSSLVMQFNKIQDVLL